MHLSNGIGYALICKFVLYIDLNIKQFVYVLTSYILAWLIGFCVPGAPGGIGIREFVLILLTEELLGKDNVYMAVIIQRIISISGDLIGFAVTKTPVKLKNRMMR